MTINLKRLHFAFIKVDVDPKMNVKKMGIDLMRVKLNLTSNITYPSDIAR